MPAPQCNEWPDHAKAVDNVHKWRLERETNLEERRRRELNEVSKRRPIVARYCRPVGIGEPLEESGSLPSGEEWGIGGSSDESCDGSEHDDDWQEAENDDDAFCMSSLAQLLGNEGGVVLSSHIRNRNRSNALRESHVA